MGWMTGSVAILAGVLGLATGAVAENRGLSPIVTAQTVDYILKECQEMPSEGDPTSAERLIDPAGFLVGYYYEHFKHDPNPNLALVQLLEKPKYGKISTRTDTGHIMYQYDAEPGYVGKDQVVFKAQYHGKTYRVVVSLEVRIVLDDNSPQCTVPAQLINQ